MESLEATGKTVEEALAKALRQLDLDREQVDVEVVSPGRPGILGFGGEPAKIIVRPLAVEAPVADAPPRAAPPARRPAPVVTDADAADDAAEDGAEREDPVAVAVEILEDLLDLMQIDAEVVPRQPETPGDGTGMVAAVLDVEGDDLGMLIGRRGETLASLQYILNLLMQRRTHTRALVGVDVGGYRRRREETLRNLAFRVAERVRSTGQSVTLEPMPPNERRIVHIALQDSPDVLTVSIGEGDTRKVAIAPKR